MNDSSFRSRGNFCRGAKRGFAGLDIWGLDIWGLDIWELGFAGPERSADLQRDLQGRIEFHPDLKRIFV
jgi:hypothetical protein